MTIERKCILVTGATGFLGSHFLYHNAARYSRVYCLVRAADHAAGLARLQRSYTTAARSYNDVSPFPANVEPLVGGLEDLDNLELTTALAKANVAEVWHFASSLNYEERRAAQLFAANVESLHRLLRVTQPLGLERFIYVSTAYTCGTARGEIPEQLHPRDGEYNNQYERSKAAAEHLVHDFCAGHDLPYTILRPSIVVGPSTTKKTGGSTTGLYGFIRELRRLRSVIQHVTQTVRIDAEEGACANFVPVDHVMRDIAYVIETNHSHGSIYHLTGTQTFPLREGFDLLCRKLGLENLALVPIPAGDESPVEQLLSRRNTFYRSYMRAGKNFARALPMQGGITLSELAGFFDEAVRDADGVSTDHLLDAERLTVGDGSLLQLYRTRAKKSGPPLVLVNAYGMPVDFFAELISELRESFSIYTWDARGVPSPSHAGQALTVAAHVGDLESVMDHFGLRNAHVIGWCTGARIALEFARQAPQRVRSLSLLNGSFDTSNPAWETTYGRNLRELSNEIAENPKYAALFFRLFFASRQTVSVGQGQQDAISTILATVNPELTHLGSLPFRDPNSLACYGRSIADYCSATAVQASDVTVPALVVSADADKLASPASSHYVASRLPDCRRSLLVPDGDHFALVHHAASVAQAIAELVHTVDTERSSRRDSRTAVMGQADV